jgi:two-component system, sensor histidine kinase PdtaS
LSRGISRSYPTKAHLFIAIMITFIVAHGIPVFAQNPRSDSGDIYLLLGNAAAYYDTEWNYSNKKKVDSAFPFLRAALTLAEDSRQPRLEHECYIHLGKYYFRCDNIAMADNYFHKAIYLDSVTGNKALEAAAWYQYADRSPAINGRIHLILDRYFNSLALYKALGIRDKQVSIYQQIADAMLRNGYAAEAKMMLHQLLILQQRIADQTRYKTYNFLGIIEANNGNYNIAINYGLSALKSLQSIQDLFLESQINSNLGKWYYELEQNENSLLYYHAALRIFQNISSPNIHEKFYAYALLRQIAQGMIRSGQAKEALTFIRQQDAQMYPETDYAKQFTYGAMADCYAAEGMFNTAETYYLKAIEQALHNGRMSNSQNEYFQMAQLYSNWKNFSSAGVYINKFFSIQSEAKDIIKLKEIQLMLFRIDSSRGKLADAIIHYQQYKNLNDSIFSEKKSKQLQELQIQYETAQKEQSIAFLRNNEKLQRSELASANFSKKLFLAGLICLLVVLILLFNDYRHKQQKNVLLQKQQDTINKKNSSLQQLINESERLLSEKNILLEEKEWLLKEVHHRVKNSLQIVISLLYSQSKLLKDEEAISAFQESQQRIHSIALMHQKLYLSNTMKNINMGDYVSDLIHHLGDAFNTTARGIQFNMAIEKVELDLSQAIPVGLILNEAITNAIKYAFPSTGKCVVNISLAEDNQGYLLQIRDNGQGFPPHFDVYNTPSLGMTLIRGLSEQLEAACEIISNGGIHIIIRFWKEKYIKTNEEEHNFNNILSNKGVDV